MTASNAFETSLLSLIFNNDTIANIGDATGIVGSTADGTLYVSLHTGDPGEAGTQTTSEATYTSYARVAVARTTGGWTVSGDTASNTAVVTFPAATGGSETITHFGIGTDSSGAGNLLFSAALNSSLAVSSGIEPRFVAGALDVTAN